MPELPESLEELKPFAEDLKKLVSAVRDPSILKKFAQGGRPKLITPNKNFAKDEFKEIWKRINHKAAYTVDFSSEELIRKSIEALDRGLNIPKLTYTVRRAEQTSGGFVAKTHESHRVDEHFTNTDVKYDLVGKVAEGTTLTRRTVQ